MTLRETLFFAFSLKKTVVSYPLARAFRPVRRRVRLVIADVAPPLVHARQEAARGFLRVAEHHVAEHALADVAEDEERPGYDAGSAGPPPIIAMICAGVMACGAWPAGASFSGANRRMADAPLS